MTNKYLEKIAGMTGLISGVGRKTAIGAGVGGAVGAMTAGEGNRLQGAIGGAAAGGVAGSLFGRKPLNHLTPKHKDVLINKTPKLTGGKNLAPNVVGIGSSKSSLAKKIQGKGFTDV